MVIPIFWEKAIRFRIHADVRRKSASMADFQTIPFDRDSFAPVIESSFFDI
jgi:hypothetical protein